MHLGATNIHAKPTQKVGFVLKTHGFNGQLKIELDEDFIPKDFLYLSVNDKFVPFLIEHFNTNGSIIKLKGFNSVDAVSDLIGLTILSLSESIADSDEPDFTGYEIRDNVTGISYPVTSMVYLPNNTLIEFRVDYKDALVPFHEDIILSINDDEKIIIAEFPDGLLDL